MDTVDFHRALSDHTRIRILAMVNREKSLCVCELVLALKEVQPKVSRHLSILRKQKIVLARKQGLWVHYQINPDLAEWKRVVLKTTLRNPDLESQCAADLKKLRRMPGRPGDICGRE